MKTFVIAVSGINATDNPGPGIPVARSLKESDLGCVVYGLSYDVNDPGHYLNHVLDGTIILPHPMKGWQQIKDKLLHLKADKGLDVIIPCLDAELPVYIKNQQELRDHGILVMLPSHEQFCYRNKENLDTVAKAIGIEYPLTCKVSSHREFEDILTSISFPIMIKGPYYKAHMAHNIMDLKRYYSEIVYDWGYPILLQTIVHGEELNVVGVGDGDGELLGMVGIKKQSTTELGKIWSGVTINNQSLLEAVKRFISQAKWNGPFEFECIVSQNQIYLIEINPRFPAWVYFASGVGVNLPERLVKQLNGIPFERSTNYAAGKVFMRYTNEVISDISLLSNLITKGEHYYEAS